MEISTARGAGAIGKVDPKREHVRGYDAEELAQLEREAIEEVAALAQRHANRLPMRSGKKQLLIRIANLRLALD